MKYILLLPFILMNTVFASFRDVNTDDMYSKEILYLQEKGVINGYEDGTFRGNNTINRAEFMKILLNASGKNVNKCKYSKPPFSDIEGTWYSDYAMIGHCEGIINGYDDGTFGGGNNINYAEASKIIVNTFGLETSTHDAMDMSGEGKITPWYQIYTGSIFRNGIAPRMDIMPFDAITRVEMAFMVARSMPKNSDSNPFKQLCYKEWSNHYGALKCTINDTIHMLIRSESQEIEDYSEGGMPITDIQNQMKQYYNELVDYINNDVDYDKQVPTGYFHLEMGGYATIPYAIKHYDCIDTLPDTVVVLALETQDAGHYIPNVLHLYSMSNNTFLQVINRDISYVADVFNGVIDDATKVCTEYDTDCFSKEIRNNEITKAYIDLIVQQLLQRLDIANTCF